MRILLTGADGFTGRHFQTLAQASGHEVISLCTNLTQPNRVAAAVAAARPEAVVHLAAISFADHHDDTAFYNVNVVGTTNLLAALTTLPITPTKVLIASSANVYGNCEASPITETQTPAPVNHYATSKLAMELMARTYMDRLPIVMTRPFNYTGPGQALNFITPKLVDHYVHRASTVALGNQHVEREFNDVRMVCDAYLALLTHGQVGEVYNVCSGQPYTLQQVMSTLAALTGHTVTATTNPAFVRNNEVHRLCGNPAKLQLLLAAAGTTLGQPTLQETLQAMLAEAKA